jgi:hypothetical protein
VLQIWLIQLVVQEGEDHDGIWLVAQVAVGYDVGVVGPRRKGLGCRV